jgi:hypothetical protein
MVEGMTANRANAAALWFALAAAVAAGLMTWAGLAGQWLLLADGAVAFACALAGFALYLRRALAARGFLR